MKRVLSIQSHTVRGYVGQKASAFPLELLGIEVDPLNSVQLSNHKAYAKGAKGQVLQGDQLLELIEGLDDNGLLSDYTHLLTGYIGSVSFLRAVISVVKKLRDRNPNIIYYCDPVLGDHGKFYVPPELVEVYSNEVLPLATVLTPNQFEIEQLTGLSIKEEADAWKCCDIIHKKGVETVIITSCSLGVSNQVSLLASTSSSFVSDGTTKQMRHQARYVLDIPLIPGRYSGTGDLMAALLLAWSCRSNEDVDFPKALELACASVHAVIRRTLESVEKGENPHRELRLVQSAQDILHPPVQSLSMKAICRSSM
jgi:pyridoxine kinase